MTLTDRNALIARVVRRVELAFPMLSSASLFELSAGALARDHGLAVSPDEIMRTLSALAEVVE